MADRILQGESFDDILQGGQKAPQQESLDDILGSVGAPAPQASDAESFESIINDEAQSTWPEVFKSIPSVAGATLRQSVAGQLQQAGEQTSQFAGMAAEAASKPSRFGQFMETVGNVPKAVMSLNPAVVGAELLTGEKQLEKLEKKGRLMGEQARRDIEKNTPEHMSFWQEAVMTAGVSMGHMGTVAIPAFLARSPGLITSGMGLLEASRSYDEARASGLDPARALRLATIKGAFEGATEYLPAKALLKDDTLMKKFVNFMAKELPGENIAELGQLAADYIYGLEDDVTLNDVLNTMALTSAATLITGGVTVPIVRAGEKTGLLRRDGEQETIETFEEDQTDDTKPEVVRDEAETEPVTEPVTPAAEPVTEEEETVSTEGIEVKEDEAVTPEEEEELIRLLRERQNPTEFPQAPAEIPPDINPNLPVAEQAAQKSRRVLELHRLLDERGATTVPLNDLAKELFNSNRLVRGISDIPAILNADQNISESLYTLPITGSRDKSKIGSLVRGNVKPGEVVESWTPGDKENIPVRAAVLSTIRHWVDTYVPDAKVVVTDQRMAEQLTGVEGSETRRGWMGFGRDGTLFISYNPAVARKEELFATVGHEFGHLIIAHEMIRTPPNTIMALLNDYREYLNDVVSKPFSQWLQKWGDAAQEREFRDNGWGEFIDNPDMTVVDVMDSIEKMTGKTRSLYYLNFDEFSAQQFIKYASTREKPFGQVEGFWKKVYDKLRTFFVKEARKHQPSLSFEAWYEMLSTMNRVPVAPRNVPPTVQEMRLNESGMDKPMEMKVDDITTGVQKALGMAVPKVHSDDPATYSPAKYNRFIRQTFNLLQLVKENTHIPGVVQYAESVRQWWADKTRWTSRADSRLKQWHIGKTQETAFNKAVFEMTLTSFEKKRKLTDEEKLAIFQEHGITDQSIMSLYERTQEDFNQAVNELMDVRVEEAKRAFAGSQSLREEKLAELAEQRKELLDREYFPLTRFGSYYISIKAKRNMTIQGQLVKQGETIAFEMFEREAEMKQRLKQLGKSNAARTVVPGKISDEVKPFIGMPQQLVDSMAEKLDLTDSQREQLELLKFETSPTQSFVKHMLRRKGVRGFNMDARRVYANYFMHFANHIARLKHSYALAQSKGRVEDHAIRRGKSPDVSNVPEQDLADHLNRHYNYIMNPGNELANLRALGFLWYLGFMPKSAFVNLTQVPLVTFPYLSSRYGTPTTVMELTRAMKDIRKAFQASQGKVSGLELEVRQAISKGVEAGFLDESFATDLAAMSEGSNLQRLLPGTFLRSEEAASRLRQFSYYGAWLFQKAEKVNRLQSFVAGYRIERNKLLDGKKFEELTPQEQTDIARAAYERARDTVESTQYEYARWNRPELFRGKKSVVFLFMQYLQNTLYFALRDKGAARFWVASLLLAGLQGVPGADDFLDMFDWGADWIKRLTGWSNVKTDAREYMRDIAEEIGVNPDYAMHGLSRNSFGLPWLADAVGVPFPQFDLSGSLSMGRIIPGLEPALSLTSPTGDFKREFPRMVTDVGGAFISIPMAMMQAIADDNPDHFKRWERAMPSIARSISKAYRFASEGQATSPRGTPLIEFDPHNPIHNAEIIGQAMGFGPTRLSQRQERDWVKREHAGYYETRRRQLMQQFDHALRLGDREALADMRKAILHYNDTVPHMSLKIKASELKRSVKDRAKARRLEELGLPRSRRMIPLYQSLDEGSIEDIE